MKRIFLILIALSAGSCGLELPGQRVTSTLRTSCPFMSDLEIEALLIGGEVDRVTTPRLVELNTLLELCSDVGDRGAPDDPSEAQCIVCVGAIIDDVYGPES